ncbi:hypothetical protein BIW11_08914 [Tropilaelaps mercedesae]|uniref:Uncharacterized protein n=1 Tax=Tropilaelaps mercedesae TaxID=418985 RepID=A0A1V9XMD0_9ACAR|nr:hypothetical protein BIW11_08914 [Tropilaelaps mercedesae]
MANCYGSHPGDEPSSSNLIINYLPQRLSDQEFHDLFAQIGPIKTCKIVRNKQSGYSYGFGFVDYHNPDDAQKAIGSYNGYKMDNKTLKVAIAKPSDSNHSKNTNVYIRGVPRNFDPAELEAMFAQFGRLVQFRVLRDMTANTNKGVAFALYDDKSNADRAIQGMSGKTLQGGVEPLQVKIADDQMKLKKHRAMTMGEQMGGRVGVWAIEQLNGFHYAGKPLQVSFKTPGKVSTGTMGGAMGTGMAMSQNAGMGMGMEQSGYDNAWLFTVLEVPSRLYHSQSINMIEELQTLMCQEIPEGRQSIKDSHTNLENVAEYCEANYFQAENKTQALEESKRYTTQSLASVAYQINTLAFNLLHLLDLQTAQLASVESQVNHIAQTVSIHKEKVARREIGVLTTNKNTIRQHKILAPANQEKPIKYVRKPIDYTALDGVGHAVRIVPPTHGHAQVQNMHGVNNYSQTAPRARRSSSSSGQGPAGPAPTQKPPTPPGQQMGPGGMGMGGGSGTLRRGDYRTTPSITPPQLPSNYAPNYPVGSATIVPGTMVVPGPRRSASNCSTLPHSHATAGHGVQHSEYLAQQQLHQQQIMSHYRQGMMGPAVSSGGASMTQHHPDTQHAIVTHAISMSSGHGSTAHYSANHGHPITSNSNVQIGSVPRSDLLPAPPANMMASATSGPPPPPPVSSSGTVSSAEATSGNMPLPPPPSGGNVSPPLPPPPEELSSPPSATNSGGVATAPTGQRGSTSCEPAWAPANYLEKVVAIYDYQADKADELSFAENALIYVIKKNDDGWYEGVMDGVQGLFPGNYVEPCM